MKLRTAQVAEILGLSERHLPVLQNHGRPEFLISRTYGSGPRNAAWSPEDVLRLAVVERFNARNVLTPAGRREIFDFIARETAAELLAGRGPRFFATDGFVNVFAESIDAALAPEPTFGRESDDDDETGALISECKPTLDRRETIEILDLHALAARVSGAIREIEGRGEVKP